MNILFVSDSFPPKCGGGGWATYNLAKELKLKGHNISILKPCSNEDEFNGIKIDCVKGFNKELDYLRLRKKAKKIIEENNIDVVVATYLKSAKACSKLKVPFVTIIHDYWPLCYKGTCYDIKSKKSYDKTTYFNALKCIFYENNIFVKLLSPIAALYMLLRTKKALRALRKSSAVFFNSEYTLTKIKPYLRNICTYVLYNIFPKKIPNENPKYSKLAENSILFSSKFNPNKGANLLIEIAKAMPNEKFVAVGNIEKSIKGKPSNLTFTGYVPSQEIVLGMMKNAKALIIPSLWEEPFGMIAVEAMMVKTPVISSNRGGLTEIIDNNSSGLLVEPSVHNFYKAIEKLKDKELRDKLSINALTVLKRFDKDKLIEVFEKGVKECMKQNKK